jgi:hypothetical protein
VSSRVKTLTQTLTLNCPEDPLLLSTHRLFLLLLLLHHHHHHRRLLV